MYNIVVQLIEYDQALESAKSELEWKRLDTSKRTKYIIHFKKVVSDHHSHIHVLLRDDEN